VIISVKMMTATDEYSEEETSYDATGPSGTTRNAGAPMETETENIPDEVDDIKVAGTVLEAAFVDPAYQWPPPDGQGKNAIELKASQSLMTELNDPNTEFDKETQTFRKKMPAGQEGVRHTKTVIEDQSYRGFWCCKWNVKEQVTENTKMERFAVDEFGNVVEAAEAAPPTRTTPVAEEVATSPSPSRDDEEDIKAIRKASRYGKVPEGILIYRLNTTTRKLELLSQPHARTNLDTLVREMVIAKASPSSDKSRRGMKLEGEDGSKATLVACEQRTAIAWLEVLDMMLGKVRTT
jgi:hypothetical protein